MPLVTLLGALGGWRVAIASHAVTALAAAAAIWLVVPGGSHGSTRVDRAHARLRDLLNSKIVALLLANTMERTCFAAMAVYLATFLLTTYGVGMHALALALALVALGNLGGNVLGGWLADRVKARPLVFAVASTVTGVVALPLMVWHAGVALSVALGFAYSLANAAGRPAVMATLSEVPSAARGAVLGLNVTMSSVGWLGAASLGGWLVATYGFASLGVLTAAASAAGALLAVAAWRVGR